MADYHRLLRVARGEEPADVVIRNGTLLNVITRDVYPATVGICEDTIAYVTGPDDARCEGERVIDAAGMWLAPGLIDSHMHIESTHVTPERFADAVLPHGVTTVAQDPHEMANVLGVAGVNYMRRAARGLPLRVLTFVPTCVPAVPGLETSGATFTAREVAALLDEGADDVLGLAEVMDYWGVVRQSPRITDIVKAGRERGVILTGHVRFEDDRDLNAYLAAGIESDHGYMTADAILARTRLGMVAEVCCATHRDNVPEAVAVWRERGRLDNVVFVTDDVPPSALVAEGHLDRGVRRAIALGVAPVDAVRAATLVPARRLRRPELGAIVPGRVADVLVVRDMATFDIHLTLAAGVVVARDGAMVAPSQSEFVPPAEALNSVHLPTARAEDFVLRKSGSRVVARTITQRGRGPLHEVVLDVVNGRVVWATHPELALVAVWHRHGLNDNRFTALIEGTGLRKGALATTYAHDSHNLVVIGRNPTDMAVAVNALTEAGGGYVAVAGGEVRALASLPVAGLLAQRPVPDLARDFALFIDAARALGVVEQPMGLLASLPLPVVPRFRPTDMGLVDVARQVIVSAWGE